MPYPKEIISHNIEDTQTLSQQAHTLTKECFNTLFVTLLKPKGKGEEAIKHLKRLKAPEGITLREVYFAFGRYDGVIIFEAPNETAAMKFIMQTGFATQYTMETLIVVPAKRI